VIGAGAALTGPDGADAGAGFWSTHPDGFSQGAVADAAGAGSPQKSVSHAIASAGATGVLAAVCGHAHAATNRITTRSLRIDPR